MFPRADVAWVEFDKDREIISSLFSDLIDRSIGMKFGYS